MPSYKARLIFFSLASFFSALMSILHVYRHDGSTDSIKFCLVMIGFNICFWIENRFINMADYIIDELEDGIDWQKNYNRNKTINFFMGPLLPLVGAIWVITLILIFELPQIILLPLICQAIREYFIIRAKKKDRDIIIQEKGAIDG